MKKCCKKYCKKKLSCRCQTARRICAVYKGVADHLKHATLQYYQGGIDRGKPGNFPSLDLTFPPTGLSENWMEWKGGGKGKGGETICLTPPPPTGFCLKYHPEYYYNVEYDRTWSNGTSVYMKIRREKCACRVAPFPGHSSEVIVIERLPMTSDVLLYVHLYPQQKATTWYDIKQKTGQKDDKHKYINEQYSCWCTLAHSHNEATLTVNQQSLEKQYTMVVSNIFSVYSCIDCSLTKQIGRQSDRVLSHKLNLLLVIHSNHGPVLYRFQDMARYLSKLQIFLGTCEASRFDSNSNRMSRFEFDSKVTCRFENFESATHAVCRHITSYAHSLFNKKTSTFAPFVVEIYV